jgi:hypothetical protein
VGPFRAFGSLEGYRGAKKGGGAHEAQGELSGLFSGVGAQAEPQGEWAAASEWLVAMGVDYSFAIIVSLAHTN